jgi:hypothetical protein
MRCWSAILSINPLNAQNVERGNIRPYLGGDEQLVGTRYVEMGFDVELVGSGTWARRQPGARCCAPAALPK